MDQQILNAIFIGSIYALFAIGYTLVFGVLDILNLPHSAVFIIAAAVTYTLVVNYAQSFSAACLGGLLASPLSVTVPRHSCPPPRPPGQSPPTPALTSPTTPA